VGGAVLPATLSALSNYDLPTCCYARSQDLPRKPLYRSNLIYRRGAGKRRALRLSRQGTDQVVGATERRKPLCKLTRHISRACLSTGM
jgi:hypothetical protein